MAEKSQIAASLARSPVIGVVRTSSAEEGARIAREFLASGLELVEITFTVPDAARIVASLRIERGAAGPPWIGMGTVTTEDRERAAVAARSDFLVTPAVVPAVARVAREADTFLLLGALTPTEILAAREEGADLIKVYPLPAVGGASYLQTIRGPLGDIPMLAAGGFGIDEIPAYRAAGAIAFGMGPPLVGTSPADTRERVQSALALARGENPS